MKRLTKEELGHILYVLSGGVISQAVLDVAVTTIGLLRFEAVERNSLIVKLAAIWSNGEPTQLAIVGVVWLSKSVLLAFLVMAVSAAKHSKPIRDDKLTVVGLLIANAAYLATLVSWLGYFVIFVNGHVSGG